MSNLEHLATLKEGAVEAWNQWRGAHPAVWPDLIGADLRGANLGGTDLSGALLLDADLREAQIWEANLSKANLIRANLGGANLSGATGLSSHQLEPAKGNSETKLPPNITRPKSWH